MKKNQKKHQISLIIPAYRQGKTIQKDLRKVNLVMKSLGYNYEIIVIVDGQVDDTIIQAKKIRSPQIVVKGYKHNKGKGYAVRFGMLQAKGDIIAFLDAGMDLDPQGLRILLDIMAINNADIVIGSKLHPASDVTYPWQRKLLSWGYRSLVRVLFGLSVRDTQVGIKFFKRKVLMHVLPRLLVKKYAFDIEILAVAHSLGYTAIYEAPITLKFGKWSSITSKNFWKAISQMLWDTAAIYYRLRIIHYYADKNKRKSKYDPELGFAINVTE